ncbi:hypothetical protein ACFL0W_05790 [Nanoarchaeota archaeon]
MDVQKIQRINQMAREFMMHGMAKTMDEATKKAEQMLVDTKDMTQLKTTMGQEEQEQSEAFDELKLNIRRQKSTITQQQQTIGELQNKIKELESKLETSSKNLAESKNSDGVVEKDSGPQTTLHTNEKKPHPKTGHFDDSEVNIEKMFYCGPKD